jgi:hypothetical protein
VLRWVLRTTGATGYELDDGARGRTENAGSDRVVDEDDKGNDDRNRRVD